MYLCMYVYFLWVFGPLSLSDFAQFEPDNPIGIAMYEANFARCSSSMHLDWLQSKTIASSRWDGTWLVNQWAH